MWCGCRLWLCHVLCHLASAQTPGERTISFDERRIGKGTFSELSRAIRTRNGKYIAIKRVVFPANKSKSQLLLWNIDQNKWVREDIKGCLNDALIVDESIYDHYDNYSVVVAVTQQKNENTKGRMLVSHTAYCDWNSTKIRFEDHNEIGRGRLQDINTHGYILLQRLTIHLQGQRFSNTT